MTRTLRICFAGITGWTAPPIVAGIARAEDLTLVAGVSRSAAGRPLAEVLPDAGSSGPVDGGPTNGGLVYGSVAEALAAAPADVLIDYTSATAVGANVRAAIEAGVHVVVGSSGLTAEDYAELDALARAHGVGVVAAGNFSVMAAVLARAATLAAEHLDHWEVIDYASATKPDVPSGTARELAESLSAVHRPEQGVPVAELHGPKEARGADVAGTRVHSVRLPSFVVSTEAVFGGEGERLSLRHDAGPSPEPYAAGTLLAVRRVAETTGVRRGLGTLLFD
ncbi:4-hydroxy-tetrahydrodipicolinate reductase [Streptomyces sp. NPDC090025]|uniref:4-hydroxy-tetrahydrodipicolinate reductase n=1 Tax=Streptomyces sp. NPDC090025 TaxID=3365922 RepID=UPI00383339EB